MLCSGLGESKGRCLWMQPINPTPSSPYKSDLNPSVCAFSEGECHAAALSWGYLKCNITCGAVLSYAVCFCRIGFLSGCAHRDLAPYGLHACRASFGAFLAAQVLLGLAHCHVPPMLALSQSLQQDFASHPPAPETLSAFRSCHHLPLHNAQPCCPALCFACGRGAKIAQ